MYLHFGTAGLLSALSVSAEAIRCTSWGSFRGPFIAFSRSHAAICPKVPVWMPEKVSRKKREAGEDTPGIYTGSYAGGCPSLFCLYFNLNLSRWTFKGELTLLRIAGWRFWNRSILMRQLCHLETRCRRIMAAFSEFVDDFMRNFWVVHSRFHFARITNSPI